jgi:hypothetical protein
LLSKTAETGKNQQSGHVECDAVHRGEWVHGGACSKTRKLALDLFPAESLGKKGCVVSILPVFKTTLYHPNLRACLKTFDKNGGVGDNRKKTSGSRGKCINTQVISAGKNIS